MPRFKSIRKLRPDDGVESFDCAQAALNQFLQRYAFNNQRANSAQTYVCCQNGVVVGFYSLSVGSVDHESAPTRVVKGLVHISAHRGRRFRLIVDAISA